MKDRSVAHHLIRQCCQSNSACSKRCAQVGCGTAALLSFALPVQCVSIENINNLNRIINYYLEPLLWQNGAHEHE
jgi:hypothetical protein